MAFGDRQILKNFLNEDKEEKEFSDVLRETQSYILDKCFSIIAGKNLSEQRESVRPFVEKFIADYSYKVKGLSEKELIDKLLSGMLGFDFLDNYLYRNDVEEININEWDSTRITFKDGHKEFTEESFSNAKHAIDVVKRMLQMSHMVFDNAQPGVRGHLSERIRITALGYGLIDESKGLAVSIRIINPQKLKIVDFIKFGTGTAEIFYIMQKLFKYGISMCIVGPTNSGKTTLLDSLVKESVDNDDRVITIEEDVREFDMVKRDENGKVINEVIHLRTRHSDDPKQDIDQEKLLEFSLTMNPDYLVISEMKGREAFEVQKAANTGNPFITSIHANSCIDVYSRMRDLCKSKSNMDDNTLMQNVTKAFPISCFAKQLKDKSRKIMEITECIVHQDETREFKTLFHFVRTGIKVEENKKVITGYFEKVNNISENIQKRLLENGITEKELNKMLNYHEVDNLCSREEAF